MEEGHGTGKMFISWQPESKEDERGRDQSKIYSSKAQPSDLFPPVRSYFPQLLHLSIVYSDFESINGLKHSLGQNPYDLIFSGNALTDTPRGVLY
jgi:hypothetical protein